VRNYTKMRNIFSVYSPLVLTITRQGMMS